MCLIFSPLSSILSYLFPMINGNPFKKQLGSDCILSAWVERFEKDSSFQVFVPSALLLALPRLLMIGPASTWELRKSWHSKNPLLKDQNQLCLGCFFLLKYLIHWIAHTVFPVVSNFSKKTQKNTLVSLKNNLVLF